MARFTVPFNISLKVEDTGKARVGLVLFNSGTVDVFLDPNQNLIDQVDSVSGVPTSGVKLTANGPPIVIPSFSGQIFARCAAQQGAIDVWRFCADCPS